ncbi:MAG: endonuclease III domain-containing protein [Candidatus Omnitrophota bacterium]
MRAEGEGPAGKGGKKFVEMYTLLEAYFGDLGWWPAGSDFEVVVGAILTQNTAWTNVEKAICRLRSRGFLDPRKIERAAISRLSDLIRPAGYHRLKAFRLKEISRFIMSECGGDFGKMKRRSREALRVKLLSVNGVGPETADSILLYALGKPVFVVDAYSRRIFSRHGLGKEDDPYDAVSARVMRHFPRDRRALNQFHALLVETAKRFCKKRAPLCGECPLSGV